MSINIDIIGVIACVCHCRTHFDATLQNGQEHNFGSAGLKFNSSWVHHSSLEFGLSIWVFVKRPSTIFPGPFEACPRSCAPSECAKVKAVGHEKEHPPILERNQHPVDAARNGLHLRGAEGAGVRAKKLRGS
jgi:hypothetical protein